MTDEEIDAALLSNITNEWRKLARVVGATMMQIAEEQRRGQNDLYFASRLKALTERRVVEHFGDLGQMRDCEIRLSPTKT